MTDILFADVGDPLFSFTIIGEMPIPFGVRGDLKCFECKVEMYGVIVYRDSRILAEDPILAVESLKSKFAHRLRSALAGPSILA